MYRKNEKHQQKPLFSSLFDLPDKEKARLSRSWAGTFYQECFCRIDEGLFAVLYSEEASRPNIPVNVLVSLEIMKSGFGWSDQELEEALHFNLQVRYALGYHSLDEGHFELRTVYNFRRRLAQHMQETGENLLEKAFEQITDKQIKALAVKTGKLRMDSTQIASNIRQMSRLQLLVEILQRVWRMLNEVDQARYKSVFAAYLRGSSGQYVYHIKSEESQSHLEAIGDLMRRLVADLDYGYGEADAYQVLARVYGEHFIEVASGLRPRVGEELSAQSLQSPDDWEASYRHKNGKGYRGYVSNVSETCDPDNDLQLIVKVQTEANSVDDARMLEDAVPDLAARTDVSEMYTDGGFNSSGVDKALNAEQIEQFQTAIRGKQADDKRLSLTDFDFTLDADGQPKQVKCAAGQQTEVKPGRKIGRFTARFEQTMCDSCPLLEPCPTQALRRKQKRVLRFSQKDFHVARRRQNQAKAKANGRNLRSAVEATVRSLKHPFGNGKLPVRGKRRVSMMMVASAAMTNVRRIWRYQMQNMHPKTAQCRRKMPSYKRALLFFALFCACFPIRLQHRLTIRLSLLEFFQ